jgi:tRNA pseudouridine38-40 synthase
MFPPRNTIPDLQKTLNALLPRDIRVRRLEEVPQSFHAQKSAKKKRYEYHIYNGRFLSPFLYGRTAHITHPLDFEAMSGAADLFLGRHDFSGFAASASKTENSIRTVLQSLLLKKGKHLRYRVEATGFLHHMVRNMMGTILEIGLGKKSPSDVPRILAGKDRRQAGATAPAEGLYLVRIWY